MLSLFVVASSAAAAPLAVAVADSPTFTNATDAATNTTTAGMNATTDAPLPEASDRRQRPWWERLAEKHRELRKGQSWCVSRSTHASLPRSPWATKHSSTLCHTQGATASRVARGFKRKRGSARALFDLGSATAQRAHGGRPSGLRSLLAAIGAPPERCCNRHATLTGRPFSRLHLSFFRRLLRCAKPSARRPIAIAARKKAGLGARCSRGDPRPFFGRARVSFPDC